MRDIKEIADELAETKLRAQAIKTEHDPAKIAEKAALKRHMTELLDEKREWIRSGTVAA